MEKGLVAVISQIDRVMSEEKERGKGEGGEEGEGVIKGLRLEGGGEGGQDRERGTCLQLNVGGYGHLLFLSGVDRPKEGGESQHQHQYQQ